MTAFFYTHFDKALKPANFHLYAKQLPSETLARIQHYRRWQDAHHCLFGRLLLRRMLSFFSMQQNLDHLSYTNYEKPYFANSGFYFNISHSGKYVVCAGSDRSVLGVDIEEIKPLNMLEYREQFHDLEWAQISNSANSLTSFYDTWTRKEAVIKGDGKGLHLPLRELNSCEKGDCVQIGQTLWTLQEILIDKKYKCYLAYQGENKSTLCKKITFTEE